MIRGCWSPRTALPCPLLPVRWAAAVILVGCCGDAAAQDLFPTDGVDPALLRPLVVQVRAVDDSTNEPLSGVEFQVRAYGPETRFEQTTTADAKGHAEVPLPRQGTLEAVQLKGRAEGCVPVFYNWGGQHAPNLPDLLTIRFERGEPIGGFVVDANGLPVVEALVSVSGPATVSEGFEIHYTLGETRTDAQGAWRFDQAPRDRSEISIAVRHDSFLRAWVDRDDQAALRAFRARTTLTQGLAVRGVVLDAGGEPLAGASVVLGLDRFGSDDPSTRTDAAGAFTLLNSPAGASAVTVYTAGHAPEVQRVEVSAHTPPLTFRLGKAATLRGRVVDAAGEPIPGAFVAADTWRGLRSLEWRVDTDHEGRFEWRDAPADEVEFDFGKQGYASARGVKLKASAEEHVVTLQGVQRVRGRVTDGETGKTIAVFKVIDGLRFKGQSATHWQLDSATGFSSGEFDLAFDEPYDGRAVRVEAPGYLPEESPVFAADAGDQSFDFALTPDEGFACRVLDPAGKPAPGAQVALVGRYLRVVRGRIVQSDTGPAAEADAQGRIEWVTPALPAAVLAVSDAGVGGLLTDVSGEHTIRLRAWGTIAGRSLHGDQPDADATIAVRLDSRASGVAALLNADLSDPAGAFLSATSASGRRVGLGEAVAALATEGPVAAVLGAAQVSVSFEESKRTDPAGAFRFERVPPGEVTVSRCVEVRHGSMSTVHFSTSSRARVASGEEAEVTLGGAGRPVVGRLVAPAAGATGEGAATTEPYAWGSLATVHTAPAPPTIRGFLSGLSGAGSRGSGRTVARVAPDGTFRLEDVTPGEYTLTATATPLGWERGAPPTPRLEKHSFTVPPLPKGARFLDEPLDLGELRAEWPPAAPDPSIDLQEAGLFSSP